MFTDLLAFNGQNLQLDILPAGGTNPSFVSGSMCKDSEVYCLSLQARELLCLIWDKPKLSHAIQKGCMLMAEKAQQLLKW